MEDLTNWATGEVVGCWIQEEVGDGGLQSDWKPYLYDWQAEEVLVPLKYHRQSAGYWFINPLPGGGGKQLWHRQLVMDLRARRRLGRQEEVHHRNGRGGGNRLANLEIIAARAGCIGGMVGTCGHVSDVIWFLVAVTLMMSLCSLLDQGSTTSLCFQCCECILT